MAVAQNALFGIDVMNLSLGHPIFEPAATDPLVQAVEAAVASGIVVVASAGNIGINPETGEPGYAGITSPGNAPGAITVGALDLHYTATRFDDTVGPFSSRGPTWYDAYAKPDLVAPGLQLAAVAARMSTLYTENPNLQVTWDNKKTARLPPAVRHEHGGGGHHRHRRDDDRGRQRR